MYPGTLVRQGTKILHEDTGILLEYAISPISHQNSGQKYRGRVSTALGRLRLVWARRALAESSHEVIDLFDLPLAHSLKCRIKIRKMLPPSNMLTVSMHKIR